MKLYEGLSTKNTCYSTAYFIYGFCILRANFGWILFTAVLLSGCTTLHYILDAERCIKPELILYVTTYYLQCAQLLLRSHCMYLRIICNVLHCSFGLSVLSSYYLQCAQLLLRFHCMYLRIICNVLNCFFGLTVRIFVLFALCSTASSTLPYVSS